MKNFILFVFLVLGYNTIAQNKANKLMLVKGQKINVVSTNTSDADMGMGMQMKNNSVSNSTIMVTGEKENDYTLTNTTNKLKASIDAMGKTHDYDSEKESDRNSELGKTLSETIGRPIGITVNKFSGAVTFEKKDTDPEKAEVNPMEDMMEAFGNGGDDPSVSGAFILIPSGKKAGDSWTERDSTKEKKTIKTFTINSLNPNTATVSFNSFTDVNNTLDVQGNQMVVSISTKSKGEIISDTKTGLVNKRVTDSDISGTIEIMGQTMPITAKSSLVSQYTLAGN